ncbi:MAG: N-glycosyltransferase [Methanobacterium sp. PtaU1.Bin242]|nr:MAG: N-glycosyltransferase [Methanobacterium sp. PtaU1.Bin242]
MADEVAVIILNWNGWKDTLECLESLYQINYPHYQVIVVDNHSQDESLEKIRQYCQGKIRIQSPFFNYQKENKPIKITEITNKETKSNINQKPPTYQNPSPPNPSTQRLILIKNDENYGFARGNNIGIEFTLKNLDPKYILLLNNDTVVDTDFLTEMVKTAELEGKIGFVGPKTYLYHEKDIIQAAGGGDIDFLKGESHEVAFMEKDVGNYDKYLELDYVGGSCLLAKIEVIKKAGMLNEAYFMYWEDVDWCFNGKEAGYKSVYSFKSKIWHKYGKSSMNYFKTYYHNRNRLYFIKKHADKGVYRSFLRHYLGEILKECGYQLIYRRDWAMFKSLFRGALDGLRMN